MRRNVVECETTAKSWRPWAIGDDFLMMERAIHNSLAVLARIQAYLRGWRSADRFS